jgi:hypothetical protein
MSTARKNRGNRKAREEEEKAARAVLEEEKKKKEEEDAAAAAAATTAAATTAAVETETPPVEEVHEGGEEDGLEDITQGNGGGTHEGAEGAEEKTEVSPAPAPTAYEAGSPHPPVNIHINDINRGGGDMAIPMEVEGDTRSPVRSPRRKKSRKDKKKKSNKSKTKRGREDISDDMGEDAEGATAKGPSPSPSILKGKGGMRSATRGNKTAQPISHVAL